MRILVNAFAAALLIAGSAVPSFAQTTSNGPTVTIFRGGTHATAASNLAGMAAPSVNGVTIMSGMPLASTMPQQTAGLPGAPLATGNGANANAGLAAGATNPSGSTAMGNAAIGAGAGVSGGTIAGPAGRGFARPAGGAARGGFGFK